LSTGFINSVGCSIAGHAVGAIKASGASRIALNTTGSSNLIISIHAKALRVIIKYSKI